VKQVYYEFQVKKSCHLAMVELERLPLIASLLIMDEHLQLVML
jgi:hypothetical protein